MSALPLDVIAAADLRVGMHLLDGRAEGLISWQQTFQDTVRVTVAGRCIDLAADADVAVIAQAPLTADTPVTVTMTAGEWDALLTAGHTDRPEQNAALARLAHHLPGVDRRRDHAEAAVQHLRPSLDEGQLRDRLRQIAAWARQPQPADVSLSHHGVRCDVGDRVWLTAIILRPAGDEPARLRLNVSMAEERHAGRYPFFTFSQREQDRIRSIISRSVHGADDYSMGRCRVGVTTTQKVHPTVHIAVSRQAAPGGKADLPGGWS